MKIIKKPIGYPKIFRKEDSTIGSEMLKTGVFSRNRFWGNPIPLWVSDDGEEVVCVGSVQELKDLSGVQDIPDLHREFIDHITIPSKQGKGNLKRIDEIFDCWF